VHAVPARLTLVERAPLVVRGRGFRSHELVRVIELTPTRRTLRIRARHDGSFVVQLVSGDRCSAVSVFARGVSGAASLKAPPPPLCPPASTP
jgi:hypothetical protein